MRFAKLRLLAATLLVVATVAKEESPSSKNRDKRQQLAFLRKGGRLPPYAVQMEPIVQYSQRDPLYNPLASPKNDDLYEENPSSYYPTEPEPIIEIIIKESNESLPTPVPPPLPSQPRPTKEPIQVFYVKYEKKKGYGDKTRVVYDPPIPALTPVEEHEEIKPENSAPYGEEPTYTVTPAPPSEPSTTLRAIIRPDSEVYHSGSSGIRVTFGTEQVPPNSHSKRSDLETPGSSTQPHVSKPTTSPGAPKRQHGPYQPLQPPQPPRVPPAFSQQRIINSFPPQSQATTFLQQQQQQQPPPPPHHHQSFPPQQSLRNPPPPPPPLPPSRPLQRHPITIQGLPEVQQRTTFNSFGPPPHHVNINHPQQPGFPPALSVSHQSVHVQNRPLSLQQNNFAEPPQSLPHYAIRENPLHPGPFPPNPAVVQPTAFPEFSQNQFVSAQPFNALRDSQQLAGNPTNHFISGDSLPQQLNTQQLNQQLNTKHQSHQSSQQSFFSQNPPTSQQRPQTTFSQQQSIWGRPLFQNNPAQKIYATPVSPSEEFNSPSTARTLLPTTTASTTTTRTTTTTEAPTTTTLSPNKAAKIKENIANLPDEVPDDIREQLLSSGILGNADIQILDYDKIGDIPIEKLPPEALANFYGAGGGAAIAAGSEPVPAIAKRPSTKTTQKKATNLIPVVDTNVGDSSTKFEQATLRPGGVEMKVVRFDPNTEQGRAVAEQHIRDDATRLEPYNRYLPLKVSGTSFPIPDVPELNGRRISSVVVLAPVDYDFPGEEREIAAAAASSESQRRGRKAGGDAQPVRFLAGDTLKQLVKKPTAENYKKWLEQESRTEPQRQSVVLLVTMPRDGDGQGDKEIFMYDVTSGSVSKLAGDLSTAFVDAAESNSDGTDSIDDSTFSTY
ncbi:Uncharacterized protein DBV15_04206 [Temnothorax longispinosus]|uniref:Uncharacterized protein n=1 Tax=Temnothorax longispinosus TaxID=300112 RepID=A0A4S2KDX6_9HYME|nr:Uncharacterized protein DBV15_04206 [Temnothorax longispinosus]